MVKKCIKCGTNNQDEAFWCINCNNKLIENKEIQDIEQEVEQIKEKQKLRTEDYELPYQEKLSRRHVTYSMLKKPIALLIVVALVLSIFYMFSSFKASEFNWDKYGGCPWDENNNPWQNLDFPWAEDYKIDDILSSQIGSHNFNNVGEINVDYWFEGEKIKTSTGWTFTIINVQDISYQARILDYYVYNKDGTYYNPTESFSQVDILFGYEDIVSNPDSYPYRIISHFYRGVFFQTTGSQTSRDYFSTHYSNTHLIPHNQDVLNQLKQIDVGDVLSITGSYVNVYGEHNSYNQKYTWTTDTEIGNVNCEIILIDTITFV